MMKQLGWLLALILSAGLVHAAPEEMVHYEAIDPPVKVDAAQGEVVVQELFWYGCGHCYHFDPTLNAWLAKKPANVRFERVAVALNPGWVPLSKAYYALRQLGVDEKLHTALFDAVHKERRPLSAPEQIADFVASHGVDREAFLKAYNGFAVDAEVRKAQQLARQYGITGVPAMVVQGKYRTSGSLAGTNGKMIEVVDALVVREAGR
ncbi:thiol:disulfide interchange protein DsbA/DsbL [Thiofaba sp. EF100]|jgi:thiol:disulfide interchange protein DsbA|uniref:thiol:disulfide interchange protein DsbA/DsbL n=1 Tax=Thiofaba sp. EF100 TaxID=3121274 RepID=UPI00322183A5